MQGTVNWVLSVNGSAAIAIFYAGICVGVVIGWVIGAVSGYNNGKRERV